MPDTQRVKRARQLKAGDRFVVNSYRFGKLWLQATTNAKRVEHGGVTVDAVLDPEEGVNTPVAELVQVEFNEDSRVSLAE